jgi:hypothetical protein
MEIIGIESLSELLADKVIEQMDRKDSAEMREVLTLAKNFFELSDSYFAMMSQEDEYPPARTMVALEAMKEAEELYFSKWDIPSAGMKAIYAVPINRSSEIIGWNLIYSIEIMGKNAFLRVIKIEHGAFMYSLRTDELKFDGIEWLDIYDYYSYQLELIAG